MKTIEVKTTDDILINGEKPDKLAKKVKLSTLGKRPNEVIKEFKELMENNNGGNT